ncbi:MAG TPA: DUF4912 domain-containing protein [Candidatus Omnitrophota bacterium]|nr:DUF4912 domain-containing protein [Candidatus Omnitrophota bacterium]
MKRRPTQKSKQLKKGTKKPAKKSQAKPKKPAKATRASKKIAKKAIRAIRRIVRSFTEKPKSKSTRVRQKAVNRRPSRKAQGVLIEQHAYLLGSEQQNGYHEVRVRSYELPQGYGDNKITLLVRDPWWLFSFWEITPQRREEILSAMRREGLSEERSVLRVYDVTGTSLPHHNAYFDIELGGLASCWYIDVGQPDREWVIEIGVRAHGGRFFMLARSNAVRTPRFGVSDVLDEEWMMPDELYWKLFGASGGLGRAVSSLEAREMVERYLKNIVSSEGSSSFSLQTKK